MQNLWKPVSVALGTLWIATLVAGVVMSLPSGLRPDAWGDSQSRALTQDLGAANNLSTSFRNVADALRPSVVSISVTSDGGRDMAELRRQLPPGFEDFFERRGDPRRGNARPSRQGQGSGVIVRADGYILTNNHVVADAYEVTVELSDGRQAQADIVGTDPETDLAVLRIDLPDLRPVVMGDSEAIRVGDWVMAIGSPFGLDQTVTAGIISGKNRVQGIIENGRGFEDFLQTDAAINPGNSGGPLVNLRGELVGINTAILSRSGASAGIGFAIPVSLANPVLNSIIENGEVRRGFLGAQVAEITQEVVDAFGLKTDTGAMIKAVLENQPAAAAGLQPGDVVLSIDGKPVTSSTRLVNYIASRPPGASVQLVVNRYGERLNVTVNLQERTDAAMAMFNGGTSSEFGAKLKPVTPEVARQYGYDDLSRGLIVTEVEDGGVADRGEVEVGDVIEAAAGRPVDSVRELSVLFAAAKDQQVPLRIVIRRGNTRMLLVIR
ncbi:MAG: Do family serine endopeptidase [Planctomycetota bacterium]